VIPALDAPISSINPSDWPALPEILVADDEYSICFTLAAFLHQQGFTLMSLLMGNRRSTCSIAIAVEFESRFSMSGCRGSTAAPCAVWCGRLACRCSAAS
jgi:hypothetical protein